MSLNRNTTDAHDPSPHAAHDGDVHSRDSGKSNITTGDAAVTEAMELVAAAAPTAVQPDANLENAAPLDTGDPAARWAGHAPLRHGEIRVILSGILLAMFLGAIDQTIVATALPTIGRTLGDVHNLSWVVTAFLLTATAVTPLYGKLCDIHGARVMMLIGIAMFILGSVVCALAPSMLWLVLGRGLQGLGAGGLLPVAQTIIGDIVLPKERGRYQAIIGAMWTAAAIIGPLLGGLLTEYLHWSFIFWINIPLGIAAYMISSRTLKRLVVQRREHSLDVIGSLLMMSAAVALLLALTSGGVRYPWLSAPILGLMALSAVLWVLFALRLKTADEPFLPLSVLANRVVRNGTFGVSCSVSVMIGLTIFIPLYFETVHGLSVSMSGVALIPMMVVTNIGAVISGRALGAVTHYKYVPMAFLSLSAVALVLLAFHPFGNGMPFVVAMLSFVGIGVGSVYPVTTVSVQNAVPRHHLGIATGTMNFFRSLASSLFVAALGVIVLGGVNLRDSEHNGELGGLHGLATAGQLTDYDAVFRLVFLICAGFLAFSVFWLALMPELPLAGRADLKKAAAAGGEGGPPAAGTA